MHLRTRLGLPGGDRMQSPWKMTLRHAQALPVLPQIRIINQPPISFDGPLAGHRPVAPAASTVRST
jgi:hypothetical protein